LIMTWTRKLLACRITWYDVGNKTSEITAIRTWLPLHCKAKSQGVIRIG
jgi:hypothetical protein